MYQFIFFFFSLVLSATVYAGSVQYCENNTNTAEEYNACLLKDVKAEDLPASTCETGSKDDISQDACMKQRQDTTVKNIEERRRREDAEARERAASGAPKPEEAKVECQAREVIAICDKARARAQEALSRPVGAENTRFMTREEAVPRCRSSCKTSNSPELSLRLKSCSSEDADAALASLNKNFELCQKPGSAPESTCRSASCSDGEMRTGDTALTEEDLRQEAACTASGGDPQKCKNVMSPEEKRRVIGLQNGTADYVVTDMSAHHQTQSVPLGNGVTAQKTTAADGSSVVTYATADGRQYSSYAAAANSRYQGPAVPEGWTPPPPSTSGGSVNGGGTNRTTTGGTGSTVASRDTTGGSGSAPVGETQKVQPTQQQPPAASGSSSGGATQAAGGALGTSSSGGFGNSNAFSNPYSNTSLTATSKAPDSQAFAALGARDSSSYGDEGVGGGGGTGDGSGGYSPSNSGSYRSGSEGVNRDAAPVGTSSFGSSSGGVVPAAYSGNREPVSKAKLEELGGSTFQNGFHRASGKEPLSASSMGKTKAIFAKLDKAKRKKIMDQCKGDMSCIASILGVTKSRRSSNGGRGLASIQGQSLPQGVWSGYTDILSHMAKVHDKLPMNYDGEID